MPKVRTRHRCGDCGAAAPRWTGRCAECGAWNSIVEDVTTTPGTVEPAAAGPITAVDAANAAPAPTGIGELDRVLGGGLVRGSVTLLGGEPGIGKSTLLLQALGAIARSGRRVLLVSAEESAQQVRLRAERLGADDDELWLAAELELPRVLATVAEFEPEVVVIDSIQTVYDPAVSSSPGGVAQVQTCAQALTEMAKQRGVSIVLVGHVTKDGGLAGPRALEHLVDTVLSFEGDRYHALRLLRALKHRFGPAGELGIFEMTETGLLDVPDGGALFLADRRAGSPGSVVVPAVEGRRTLLVEVQGLVSANRQGRRYAQGLDIRRVEMLLAVLERQASTALQGADVYASAVGGIRTVEPAADLGIVLAVASSFHNRPLPGDLCACGEVGLGGEVRQVGHLGRRLGEAARLGFTRALVPASAPDGPAGLALLRVGTVSEAMRAAGIAASTAC
jgi:DNA repair protein RadA/Sms